MIDKVIHNMSVAFVDMLQGDNKYSELKYAKVTYSIEMLISELSKILIATIIFFMCGRFYEYVFCFVVLVLTRSFIGGLHAKTYIGCLGMSIFFFGFGMAIKEHVHLSIVVLLVMFLIYVLVIAFIAPVQSANRLKLDKRNKYKQKMCAVLFSTVFCVIVYNLFDQYFILLIYVYWFQMIAAIYKLISLGGRKI